MPDRSERPVRVAIMGAAGRDFHNFNVVYRNDPGTEVVAFTATQIPDIAGRRYPPVLAGQGYPDGIPIVDESGLADLVRDSRIDRVVFAYSDVSHADVMHSASVALAAGADFTLLGPNATMLGSRRPVIAVSAVRTGCGKSQTARWLSARLRAHGLRVVALRHPMPYGDLARQAVQRLATLDDLADANCTVEEREEYEPHIRSGTLVFAGVDYAAILAAAEAEADILLWDGGNNDFPFLRPDFHVVLVDPLRPEGAITHHPGETVLRMADVVVIAKTNAADAGGIARVSETARALAPGAPLVEAESVVTLDDPAAVPGRRVLVVEDGPTITHGNMPWGAGYVAARDAGAGSLVDPRPVAAPEIAEVFRKYPHIGPVLPAVGYGPRQLRALAATIAASDADLVIAATPADIARLIAIDKPVVRARYEYGERGEPSLSGLVDTFLRERGLIR
jgi:predicted GTPase